MDPAPPPSERLIEAAIAERTELDRHVASLRAQRQAASDHLAEIDRGLVEVAERQALLDRLASLADTGVLPDGNDATNEGAPANAPIPASNVLRGPAVRKTAVQALLSCPQAEQGIHYRQWFDKLAERGYEVVGKDALAVFLTQITRSPVVLKTGQPGVYRLDRQAVPRLQRRLEELDRTLREIGTITSTRPEDLQLVKTRRTELRAEVAQVERALEEAIEALHQ